MDGHYGLDLSSNINGLRDNIFYNNAYLCIYATAFIYDHFLHFCLMINSWQIFL